MKDFDTGRTVPFFATIINVISRRLVFQNVPFTVATVDPRADDLRLLWKDESGRPLATLERVEAWAAVQKKPLLLATNAGIYSREWRPLGLHVERGKTLVKLNRAKGSGGNFSMRPNGVFAVTTAGKAIVKETEAFARARLQVRLASQSGPLLLAKGRFHPAFQKRSPNAKIRNAVGATGEGRAVFALAHAPVTFWTLASLFKDALNCPDALYLDGSISGMLCPAASCREPGADSFVGIFAVLAP